MLVGRDKANELANRRIEHMNENPKDIFCCKRKSKKSHVIRPKKIAISWSKRCGKPFGPLNFILFCLYRLIRVLFFVVWFYYLPLVFIFISNLQPVLIYWDKIDGCDEYAANDCVGSEGECQTLCEAYLDADVLKRTEGELDFN